LKRQNLEALIQENQKLKAELAEMKERQAGIEHSSMEQMQTYFERLFDTAPLGYILFDAETRILNCNTLVERRLGIERTMLIGMNIKQQIKDPKMRQAIRNVFERGSGFFEGAYESTNTGKKSYVRAFFLRLTSDSGRTMLGVGILEDVSQNQRALEAVQSAESSYMNLFQNVLDAIYIQGKNGAFIDVNKGAEQMYGYSRSHFMGKTPEFLSAPDSNDMEQVALHFEKALQGVPQNFEFWGQRKNGEIFPKEVRLARGQYYGQTVVLAIAQDITERKRNERLKESTYKIARKAQSLKDEQEFYRLIHHELSAFIDTRNLFIAIISSDGKYLKFPYMSDQQGDKMTLVPLNGTLCEQVQQAGTSLLLNTRDLQALERKGSLRLVGSPCKSWLGSPLILDGELFGMIVVQSYDEEDAFSVEDVKLLEFVSSQLAISIRHISNKERIVKLTHAIEQSPVAVLIVNRDIEIEYFNSAYLAITNQIESDLLGSPCTILTRNHHINGEPISILEEVGPHSPWHGDLTLHRADGNIVNTTIMASTLLNEAGEVIKYLLLIEDVSEGHRLRQQLNQAQKMESVGTLAGGIAHDFNNLLTVVNGYAQLLIDDLHDFPVAQERVIHILKSGVRAKEMTSKLLAFSRKQLFDPRPIDLNEVLENQFDILKRLIGEDIALSKSFKKGIMAIKADPSQIEQIVMNLVINARDAIRERAGNGLKSIRIVTDEMDLDADFIALHPGSHLGKHLLLSISDSGIGMDPDLIGKIFDPFFTTKEQGKGTGLGLSTVYGIIKQNQGSIYFDSQLGEGTTVKIFWPVSDHAPQKVNDLATTNQTKNLSGSETILLVEDDEDVRQFALTTLKQQGYQIFEAEDGEKALEMADQLITTLRIPDLLITDMVMPGMDGETLATQLRKILPKLKVIFTSGYTSNQIMQQKRPKEGFHFLQKPFTPLEIQEKARFVLDQDGLSQNEELNQQI